MKKIDSALVKSLLTIDHSDLRANVSESLRDFGYYAHQSSLANSRVRVSRMELDRISGDFFTIAKEEILDNGRPPSDKSIEFEMATDDDVLEAKENYIHQKEKAETLLGLVNSLEIKLELLRTLMADERTDKQLHLKND